MEFTTEPQSSLLALPARMNIAEDKLGNLEIALLKFPFYEALKAFESRVCEIKGQGQRFLEGSEQPPFRLLNNSILACTSSVVHGFEFYGSAQPKPQMLAVGRPVYDQSGRNVQENVFDYPSVGILTEPIGIWLRQWAKQEWLKTITEGEGKGAWNNLLAQLANPTEQWEKISVQTLLDNIDTAGGIGYQAISSLLVSLLHRRVSIINGRPVEWRKALGGRDGASGLYLLSCPFKATYTQEPNYQDKLKGIPPKVREGYFAYRIDFLVQTQAGRFNSRRNLKPWIFLRLSCQRYASEKLSRHNFSRKVSILMGLNEERLADYKVDSTLVRLEAERRQDGWHWLRGLAEFLEEFKVAPLPEPQTILDAPAEKGNFSKNPDWKKDEYYLVHAEGYKYGDHGAGHSIKTGYQFKERQEVVGQILKELNHILESDAPFETDIPAPAKRHLPLAMKSSDMIYHKPSLSASLKKKLALTEPAEIEAARLELVRKQRRRKQATPISALERVLGKDHLQLLIIYQQPAELEIMVEELRELFLLNEGEEFPSRLEVVSVMVEDLELCLPLDRGDLKWGDNAKPEFKRQLKRARETKLTAWRNFLREHTPRTPKTRVALIALPTINNSDHESQGIKGVVREACALEGISSQFLRGVRKSKKLSQTGEVYYYTDTTRGKVKNAVSDLMLRQSGLLYGPPSQIYHAAKLPSELSDALDLVGLFRLDKNLSNYKVSYPLAIRLRANGEVEFLLSSPEGNVLSDWQPYHKAGPRLGQLFHEARREAKNVKDKKLKLSNSQFARFAYQILTTKLDRPSLALIEAPNWRNGKHPPDEHSCWPQLKNSNLFRQKEVLDFSHVNNLGRAYQREEEIVSKLIGVVRIRAGNEAPQYIASTNSWEAEGYRAGDFMDLSGFIDRSVKGLLHYFSLGRLPKTQELQKEPESWEFYKQDDEGAGNAFKHQQFIELVPFFLHPRYQSEEMQIALCRAIHYLRISPAWTMGNINLPYPLHLAQQLAEDQMCILE